jgi:hypothetical protein
VYNFACLKLRPHAVSSFLAPFSAPGDRRAGRRERPQRPPANTPAPIPPPALARANPAKPKLTPQQKLGLRLLKLAQSEAASLQPDTRAVVLWQASHGYARIDPARAGLPFENAFRVTLSIDKPQDRCTASEAELCGTKYWLQKQILQDLIERSKRIGEIEPLFASAEPEVRQKSSIEPKMQMKGNRTSSGCTS